jgi:phage tail-like protein
MAIARDRPYRNGNYLVDLGSGDAESVRAGFSEVILPDAAIEAIEYRNGNERSNEARKLLGPVRYENLVLKRGLIGDLDLYNWWNQARNGELNALRNVTVSLLTEDRTATVFTWHFRNARPARYGFTHLAGEGDETVLEIFELAFERMEIE